MHDDYIVQCSLDFSEQKLFIQTYNNETKAEEFKNKVNDL